MEKMNNSTNEDMAAGEGVNQAEVNERARALAEEMGLPVPPEISEDIKPGIANETSMDHFPEYKKAA